MCKEHWINKTVEWWFVICGTCPVARSRAVAFISVSPNFIRTLVMWSIKILYLIGLLLQWIVDQKVSKKCHFTWISRSWLAGGSLESSRVPHCWTEPSVINRTWLVTWSCLAWFINSLTVFVCYCWHSNAKTKRFVEGSIKREMRGWWTKYSQTSRSPSSSVENTCRTIDSW